MADSILDSVKKVVNITPDNPEFDQDIIMYINSAFGTLHQLGVGPIQGFAIDDATTTWDDFLKGDLRFNGARQYVAQKVRLAFDPPSTSFAIEAMQKSLAELEFRLNVAREFTIYGLPTRSTGGGENPGGGTTPGGTTLDGGSPTSSSDTVYDGGTP